MPQVPAARTVSEWTVKHECSIWKLPQGHALKGKTEKQINQCIMYVFSYNNRPPSLHFGFCPELQGVKPDMKQIFF